MNCREFTEHLHEYLLGTCQRHSDGRDKGLADLYDALGIHCPYL
jgi:hypothetical protein